MKIKYYKYHALKNDFLIVEESDQKLTPKRLENLALTACNRRSGIGADGIVYLSESKVADYKFDIYNADGSWAEKSGNGLRIAGYHRYLQDNQREFSFKTGNGIDRVRYIKKTKEGSLLMTELGTPEFDTKLIPIKSQIKFMINAPLELEGYSFPVTCLSVGNPHTVLLVENFDFDWQTVGFDIEHHKIFPNRTNVEFVKPINRKKLKVADWERGAGATGSSGTGAAAAVCACVMLGICNRECEVVFENGSLFVNYNDENIVELTGPAEFISSGEYEL